MRGVGVSHPLWFGAPPAYPHDVYESDVAMWLQLVGVGVGCATLVGHGPHCSGFVTVEVAAGMCLGRRVAVGCVCT